MVERELALRDQLVDDFLALFAGVGHGPDASEEDALETVTNVRHGNSPPWLSDLPARLKPIVLHSIILLQSHGSAESVIDLFHRVQFIMLV